jgi:hypothetical protein
MTIKFTNNATTTLAAGINSSVTSLTVATGAGALFPSLSGSDVFYVTLANISGAVEIVKVTARSTDTFTIVRAQDNTTALSWSTGDKVELRPTAGVLNTFVQQDPTAPSTFGFKNRIINGAMMIDQRNAGGNVSLSSTPQFVTDRFQVRLGTGSGHVAARSTDAPTGFKNSLAVTVGTGGTPAATDGINYIIHWIEGYNGADFGFGAVGAATLAVSFWVKSSLTGQFGASLVNYGLTRSYPFTYTINSANTWEQKTVTISGDTTGTWSTDNSGWGGIIFDLGNGANYLGASGAWAGADYRGATGDVKVVSTSGATFKVTGVQLEKGSTATSFDYRPYGTELALCQRYLPAINSTSTASAIGPASALSATSALVSVSFTVPVRAAPTGVTVSSPSHCNVSIGAAGPTASVVALNQAGLQSSLLTFTVSGLITGQAGVAYFNNASGQILFTGCEL